jgi:hypothetical protein
MFERPHHHDFLAGDLRARAHQHLLDARGGAGGKEHLVAADQQAPHVHGVEPIHILVGVDGQQDRVLVDVLGQGELHQDAVDLRVLVVALDQGQQGVLTGLRR